MGKDPALIGILLRIRSLEIISMYRHMLETYLKQTYLASGTDKSETENIQTGVSHLMLSCSRAHQARQLSWIMLSTTSGVSVEGWVASSDVFFVQ